MLRSNRKLPVSSRVVRIVSGIALVVKIQSWTVRSGSMAFNGELMSRVSAGKV